MSTFELEEAGLPSSDDKEAWEKYWQSKNQPWPTEPEISKERQEYLAERRKIKPDPDHYIYPFKDIKLSCADVEWLLSTHENGRGPIDWNDESQRERKGLDLRGADLRGVDLQGLPLAKCDLNFAHLEGADLGFAHFEEAQLLKAHLEGAFLGEAHLEDAFLGEAHLEGAELITTHLEGAFLCGAHLEGASLDGVFFDRSTILEAIELSNHEHAPASLCDIHWGDVNVAAVGWSTISILGDEHEAKEGKNSYQYERAARAYRQLSIVLRNQGIIEHAARFAYRAQLMQRTVFRLEGKRGQYLFSHFLDLLSGYGYRPMRCFIAYLLVILTFATTYFIIGHTVGPVLSPLGSFIFSMTSFHGRGFFPGGITLDDPLTVIAALEAFIGLLIEVTFIATLTQRLFGK